MTVRSDISVDWYSSPRIITVASPSTEITLQDLVDTIRSIEDDLINTSYDHLLNAAGKDDLGGGVYVGITVTLQNAKLAFEARPGPDFVQCNVSGGNLVAVDSSGNNIDPIQTTAYTQVVRTSSSSATLQEEESIQYSSFNGGVTIDITSPYSGTTFPIGTIQQPVNNLTDAMTIATDRGFDTIFVIGDFTIDTSGDYSGMTFIGESMTRTNLTISSGANVENCEFENAYVTGTLDGNSRLYQCRIGDLNYIYGVVESCMLQGTITLGGGNPAHFLDCWSGIAGTGIPIIDLGGSGQDLSLRNYNGGIKLINKTGTESVSIDLNSGQVILDSTITDGNIIVRGVGQITNNSTATVDTTYLLSTPSITNAIWNEPLSDHTSSGTFGDAIDKVKKIVGFLRVLSLSK